MPHQINTAKYGTMSRGDPKQVHISELQMSRGGVLRQDKALREESYLIETIAGVEKNKRPWIMLPFARQKLAWDMLMVLLIVYTVIT
eukprot:5913099-Prymnesium_polylepis.1